MLIEASTVPSRNEITSGCEELEVIIFIGPLWKSPMSNERWDIESGFVLIIATYRYTTIPETQWSRADVLPNGLCSVLRPGFDKLWVRARLEYVVGVLFSLTTEETHPTERSRGP